MAVVQSTHLIEVSPDSPDIWSNGPEVVPRLPVTDVASADDLLDLARHEELAELEWERRGSEREVEIS